MNDSSKTYAALELSCVFFWFLFDGFWLMEWKIAAYVFCGLALTTVAMMFFFIKRELALILVACADASWLVCNVTWAIGDLSHIAEAFVAAKAAFFVGLALCGCALLATDARKRLSALILSRIRIVRHFEK